MSGGGGLAKGVGRVILAAEEVASLKEASRLIFGNLPWSPVRTGNKIFRRALIGEKLATYYPTGISRIAKNDWYGYKTDQDIWRENRLARAYLRGNPPTKKGQGKRAQGKAKKK